MIFVDAAAVLADAVRARPVGMGAVLGYSRGRVGGRRVAVGPRQLGNVVLLQSNNQTHFC